MKYLFTQLMALIVVAPFLAAPAQAGTTKSVKPTSPETVVDTQIAAYNRGDIEAFAATFAPDVKTYAHPNTLQISGIEDLKEGVFWIL